MQLLIITIHAAIVTMEILSKIDKTFDKAWPITNMKDMAWQRKW